MFILKRNRILLEKLNEYMAICDSVMNHFQDSFNYYLKNGSDNNFSDRFEQNLQIEENADDLLHIIENMFYEKSLLPESREDLLTLLESYDDIIDCSVHILTFLYTRKVDIPDSIKNELKKLVKTTDRCYRNVHIAVDNLLDKRDQIPKLVRLIDNDESLCDTFQRNIIRSVFKSSLPESRKIILANLVDLCSQLADHCEDCADIITLINVKRVI